MSFNASKCSVIRITLGRRKKIFQSIDNLYLVMKVTEGMSRTSQLAEVASMENRTLGFLCHNFEECTRDVKAATYITMVRPVLEYASLVWDPH